MTRGLVDRIVVGADRIAANGDVANKIGTYTVAVLADRHDVPFYVAAPLSTIDRSTPSGADIPIEQRDRNEVTQVFGTNVAPDDTDALNIAFDVTPTTSSPPSSPSRACSAPPTRSPSPPPSSARHREIEEARLSRPLAPPVPTAARWRAKRFHRFSINSSADRVERTGVSAAVARCDSAAGIVSSRGRLTQSLTGGVERARLFRQTKSEEAESAHGRGPSARVRRGSSSRQGGGNRFKSRSLDAKASPGASNARDCFDKRRARRRRALTGGARQRESAAAHHRGKAVGIASSRGRCEAAPRAHRVASDSSMRSASDEMVEAVGIEPTSEEPDPEASTCVAFYSRFSLAEPVREGCRSSVASSVKIRSQVQSGASTPSIHSCDAYRSVCGSEIGRKRGELKQPPGPSCRWLL